MKLFCKWRAPLDNPLQENIRSATFGRRKLRPRVLVCDEKEHIRRFISNTLDKLGFLTFDCARLTEFNATLGRHLPDLVIFGFSEASLTSISETFNLLATKKFRGKVLIIGPRDPRAATAVRNFRERAGLAMLPILATPFTSQDLRASIDTLLPEVLPPAPRIDVAEALSAGWLELWYQPQFNIRTLSFSGAEALIRVRHPNWGIVEPASFLPDSGDPQFRALSEFVIHQAIKDWSYFLAHYGHVEIAINLPISFIQDSERVTYLCRQMPAHPDFEGLTIEVDSTEIIPNLSLLRDVRERLRLHKMIISMDDLGPEWPLLMEIEDMPFSEI
jgi:hypothetical protein